MKNKKLKQLNGMLKTITGITFDEYIQFALDGKTKLEILEISRKRMKDKKIIEQVKMFLPGDFPLK